MNLYHVFEVTYYDGPPCPLLRGTFDHEENAQALRDQLYATRDERLESSGDPEDYYVEVAELHQRELTYSSPGSIAYEVYCWHMDKHAPVGRVRNPQCPPWMMMSDEQRHVWEEIARGVLQKATYED